MLPEGWKNAHLASLCEKISDGIHTTPDYDEHSDVFFVNGNNIQPNGLNFFENTKRVSQKDYEKYKKDIGSNTILMSINGTIGNTCLYNNERVVLGKSACYLNVKDNTDLIFILHSLRSSHLQNYFLSELTGTTIRNLSLKTIKTSNIPLPPLPEQKKIAAILSTWDRAIEGTEKLLANSQQQKKALMQQLLTGKKRLPGFTGEWKKHRLSDFFVRLMQRNTSGNTNVVTISAQDGLVKQEEYFKKTVASDTLDGYFLLEKGDFAYNKSYSIGYPMGAIKRLNRYDKGVVTTLYICFRLKSHLTANGDFFEFYFDSGLINYGLTQIAHEGGRAHGLLNVKPADFMHLQITVPAVEEQKSIAAVLTTADKEITALESDLSRLRQEKKALMQQLLTGKRRVRVD